MGRKQWHNNARHPETADGMQYVLFGTERSCGTTHDGTCTRRKVQFPAVILAAFRSLPLATVVNQYICMSPLEAKSTAS